MEPLFLEYSNEILVAFFLLQKLSPQIVKFWKMEKMTVAFDDCVINYYIDHRVDTFIFMLFIRELFFWMLGENECCI